MPTVFSAKLDGSFAVRYQHVSLVVFSLSPGACARGRRTRCRRPDNSSSGDAGLGGVLSFDLFQCPSSRRIENIDRQATSCRDR